MDHKFITYFLRQLIIPNTSIDIVHISINIFIDFVIRYKFCHVFKLVPRKVTKKNTKIIQQKRKLQKSKHEHK